MDKLKEFKDYYCKFKCKYKLNRSILEKFEVGVYCPICNDYFDTFVEADVCHCDYCQIENFIKVFELENM